MAYNKHTKDKNAIALGRCDIYISNDYVANLANLDTVLTDSDYMGNSLTTELQYSRIAYKQYECDSDAPTDTLYGRHTFNVTAELNEMSKENLALILAGTFDNTVSEIKVGDRLHDYFRLELRYIYPNKKDAMHVVIPKVSIDTSDRLRFILDNNTRPDASFGAHTLPDDATWASYKTGARIYFVTV